MVDIENYVINFIQTRLEAAGKTVTVDSLEQPFPSEFPCVSVREVRNVSRGQSMDEQSSERHVLVIYQIDVYVTEKPIKATCKEYMKIIDEAMRDLKFTRTEYDISISGDRTVAWGTIRYRATVGAPVTSGDNQVYQMYR